MGEFFEEMFGGRLPTFGRPQPKCSLRLAEVDPYKGFPTCGSEEGARYVLWLMEDEQGVYRQVVQRCRKHLLEPPRRGDQGVEIGDAECRAPADPDLIERSDQYITLGEWYWRLPLVGGQE